MNIGFILPNNLNKIGTRHFYLLEINEMIKQGHTITPIPVNTFNYPTPGNKGIFKKIDFVIAHYPQMGIYADRLGKPFGTIYHGPTESLKSVFEELNKMDNCKWIGYECDYNKKMLEDWNIKKDLTYWIPVVDTSLFIRKEPLGDRVLCGSRHIRMKGIDVAIKAYDDIWCFGDGDDKEYTELLHSISKNTHFTGRLKHDGLKELFEKGWLYLFPSTTSFKTTTINKTDGIPTVIQEALAMGLQVIASPIGGVPEIKHIHLCEPNVEKIKDMIDKVPKKLNEEGMKYIHEGFNPKICVNKMLKDIEDYL